MHHRANRLKTQLPLMGAVLATAIIPFIKFFATEKSYALQSRLDIFEFMLSDFLPILFPVLILLSGCLALSGQLSSRFLVYTRTREDIRRTLVHAFTINALRAAMIFGLTVWIVGIFAFTIAPGLLSNALTPNTNSGTAPEAGTNTFSFLSQQGWGAYVGIYGLYVAVLGAIWSSGAFLLILNVSNRYLALSLPFLIYHLGNFVAGVLGVAMFSPVSAIFPFNIVPMPIWTVLVPGGLALLAVVGISMSTYKNADQLESLT